MENTIKSSIALYSELLPFDLIFNSMHDMECGEHNGYRGFVHGSHTLIINEGGIQNGNISPEIKGLLKGYDWQNIFKLLPKLPKTVTGKFTGKIIFHTNEAHLQKIEFIPKIKP